MEANILIIDDEKGILDWLQMVLTKDGYQVRTAMSGELALGLFRDEHFDIVILDIKMKPLDGIEVLRMLKEINPEVVVIMITAYASVESAVCAMKLGAYDYITKPFRLNEIKMVIKKALSQKRIVADTPMLQKKLRAKYNFVNIIGQSKVMQNVFRTIEKIAKTNTTVLIYGESGTGKELVSRAIHYNSLRAKNPFVSIDCGALPEELLQSELFGHIKGSFTGAINTKEGLFEVADQGTLFLDEVGELTGVIQVKLLRVLQEREIRRVGATKNIKVDVRIIAATNKNLEEEVNRERFRKDLFYRLSVIPVYLPPLRERKEDIPQLVEHFLHKFSSDGIKRLSVAKSVMSLFEKYNWPGNVRELENTIERMITLSEGQIITADILPEKIKLASLNIRNEESSATLKGKVADFEKTLILNALKECSGNQNKAAKSLGLTRQDLYYKLKKYNITDNELQN
ncbi:MAG: sigma-54 dependent transcriptional regulator [Candidatus Omnitrophota bacterium]